jgi:plasmid stability protein
MRLAVRYAMANLQVKDIDENLYEELKHVARRENRSVTQEVVHILSRYLANPQVFDQNPTLEFLALSGSYDDSRPADKIVSEMRKNRKNSDRFRSANGFLD